MNKRQIGAIVRQIEKHEKAVAKTRDNLDDYIDHLTSLKDDCEEAHACLMSARGYLSELV